MTSCSLQLRRLPRQSDALFLSSGQTPQALDAGKYKIECENSYEMVDVRRLIDDVNLQPLGVEREINPRESPLERELAQARDESFSHRVGGKRNGLPRFSNTGYSRPKNSRFLRTR
jgi:hypothetical protein